MILDLGLGSQKFIFQIISPSQECCSFTLIPWFNGLVLVLLDFGNPNPNRTLGLAMHLRAGTLTRSGPYNAVQSGWCGAGGESCHLMVTPAGAILHCLTDRYCLEEIIQPRITKPKSVERTEAGPLEDNLSPESPVFKDNYRWGERYGELDSHLNSDTGNTPLCLYTSDIRDTRVVNTIPGLVSDIAKLETFYPS